MTAHPAELPADVVSDTSVGHWLAQATQGALPPETDDEGSTGFAACALSADLQAAGEARRFARATLSGWEMAPLADDVAVIVSELLSNALRYGMTGPKDGAVPPRPVWLSLARRGRTLLCAVCDHSPDVPVIKEPDYFAQSGRGLHVIDSLSESWGWTPPNPAGKAVWAALST